MYITVVDGQGQLGVVEEKTENIRHSLKKQTHSE